VIVAIPATPALLESLLEMLVISFDYSESEGRFVLVTDYWDRSPGSDRDFIRIVGTNVEELTRYPGGRNHPDSWFTHSYNLRDHRGSFVVQCADMTGENGAWQLHLDFGYSVGAVHLRCGHVAAARRGTICRRTPSVEFQYYALDGSLLDFHAPFDDEPPRGPS
jgi:hypothetical protein